MWRKTKQKKYTHPPTVPKERERKAAKKAGHPKTPEKSS
jgi:hypothetical protein